MIASALQASSADRPDVAVGLFEVRDLRRLYRLQRWEFWLSVPCFAGVALLGPVRGILLAIAAAVRLFPSLDESSAYIPPG